MNLALISLRFAILSDATGESHHGAARYNALNGVWKVAVRSGRVTRKQEVGHAPPLLLHAHLIFPDGDLARHLPTGIGSKSPVPPSFSSEFHRATEAARKFVTAITVLRLPGNQRQGCASCRYGRRLTAVTSYLALWGSAAIFGKGATHASPSIIWS